MAWRHHKAQRQIGKSILYLRDVENFLMEFCAYCYPDHPELIEYITGVGAGIMLAEELLEDFWLNNWGEFPKDLRKQQEE